MPILLAVLILQNLAVRPAVPFLQYLREPTCHCQFSWHINPLSANSAGICKFSQMCQFSRLCQFSFIDMYREQNDAHSLFFIIFHYFSLFFIIFDPSGAVGWGYTNLLYLKLTSNFSKPVSPHEDFNHRSITVCVYFFPVLFFSP